MLDLTRLRLLRELAHRGTMTAVAAAFGMTSSGVSQQLATLEHEARATLLERVGRRVRLTGEGQRLAEHAERILRAVETAELDLRQARDTPRGVLDIGCFSTFARVRLTPALVRIRDRYPDLHMTVRELEPTDAFDAVRDGRCHMAVTFAYNLAPRPETPGFAVHPLMDEPVLLALPDAWPGQPGPIDLKRLAQADWIVGSRQSDDHQLAERACALAGFAPRITHTIDDYGLMLDMVAAGLGVGFAPKLAFAVSNIDGVVARPVAGATLRRTIQAVTRQALSGSPMVRAVLTEIEGSARPTPSSPPGPGPRPRRR